MTSNAVHLLLLVILIQHETDSKRPPSCHPTNCRISEWSLWSRCTHRCGYSGIQSRIRRITKQATCFRECPYNLKEERPCNRDACQNGGTPAAANCKCKAGFTGTCCEIAPTTAPTTASTTPPTTAPTTASASRSCLGGYLPNTRCNRNYAKVGAFREQLSNRAFPVLLLTDRDCSSKKNDGHKLDRSKFEDSIHSLACRCSTLVRERGWKMFGLQYYGECWSGPSAQETFKKYGTADASDTVQVIGKQFNECNKDKPQECIGKARVNYVYRI